MSGQDSAPPIRGSWCCAVHRAWGVSREDIRHSGVIDTRPGDADLHGRRRPDRALLNHSGRKGNRGVLKGTPAIPKSR